MQQLNTNEERDILTLSLYKRYALTILAYLSQQTLNQQDAEDLLLEIFVAVLNSGIPSGLTDEQQLAWLRRIAKNKAIDRYRHSTVITMVPIERFLEIADGNLTPEERTLQQEQYEHLYRAIEQLSPQQQKLIRLRFGNGLRLVEIAHLLNKPDGTVRHLFAQALRRLRAAYQQQEKEK